MKLIIVTLLIMSLLWAGCQSFYIPNMNEDLNFNDHYTEEINIVLLDGTEVRSDPYLHIYTLDPSDLLTGQGKQIKYWYTDKETKEFSGKVYMNDVDSLVTVQSPDGTVMNCYLKNSPPIIFEKHKYFRITPQDSLGFWVKGIEIKDDIRKDFTGRISLDSINRIEIQKENKVDSVLLIVGIVAVIIGIIAISQIGPLPVPFEQR